MKLTKQQKEELKDQLKEQKREERSWDDFIKRMKEKKALISVETPYKKPRKNNLH